MTGTKATGIGIIIMVICVAACTYKKTTIDVKKSCYRYQPRTNITKDSVFIQLEDTQYPWNGPTILYKLTPQVVDLHRDTLNVLMKRAELVANRLNLIQSYK